MRAFVILLGAAVVACSPSGGKQSALRPTAGGHVRDAAGIMSAAAENRVDAGLAKLEATTSDQVAVVTVVNLAGQPIERFSLDYARRWGLGRKDLDNGVLVMVAPNEHKVRIEVGTGLEELLTDERAGVIVNEMIVPFKAGNYEVGIELGVARIDTLLMSNRKRPQYRRPAMQKAA